MMKKISENKLQVFLKNIIPAFIGSGFVYLLSVVDGIIIGQGAGTKALGAVNLAIPFIYITLAYILGVSSGGGTVASIQIGKGNSEEAQNAFMHSLLLSVCAGILIFVPGVLFAKQIASFLGANEIYLEMAAEYIYIWAAFALFQSISLTLQEFFRIDDSQMFVMILNGIGTAVNIVLDMVFIFKFHKGVFGAALASGISQLTMFTVGVVYFFIKKGKFRIRRFTVSKTMITEIFLKGIPTAISQFGTMVLVAAMNVVLLKYVGPVGVDSFAIISYVASFGVSCFIGTTMGVEPLLGKSYGEKNASKIKWYFKAGIIFNIICGAAMFLLFVILRKQVCLLFGASGEILKYASDNMWKICLGIPFDGITCMVSVYLYATEKTKEAIGFNVLKNLVISYAFITFLPALFGTEIIMFSFAIYQAVMVFIGIVICKKHQYS